MPKIQFFLQKLNTTIKYYLTPKEILILVFFLFFSFIAFLFVIKDITNYLKVDRIIYSGRLTEGIIGYPQVVSPYQNLNQAEKNLSALLFSPLIKGLRMENGQIKYDLSLAEKVETNSEFSEIKVTLRDDTVFSNGDNLTTEDVSFTFSNLPIEKNWTEEIVDEKTILFKFKNNQNKNKAMDNLELLTHPIISKSETFSGTYSTQTITSGSFKIEDISKDTDGNITRISLKRFDNGERKLPYLKYYAIYFFKDEAEALSGLQTKELDLLSAISGQIISKIKDDPTLKISKSKMPNNFSIFLNQNKNEYLRNTELRQVLDDSIDRNQLINQVLGGYALPMQNILGTDKAVSKTEDLIKKIVSNKESGLFFENGVLYKGKKTASSTNENEVVQISITTINNKELIETANFVANSWKKLGIQVTVKTIERSELQQVVRERDFDSLIFGFSIKKVSDYKSFFHSDERTFPKLNIANYASKKADQLIDNLDEKTLPELSKVIENDVPVILLYKPLFTQIVTGKVETILPDVINQETDKYILLNNWFIETERVLPWFETNARLKDLTMKLDLLIK